MTIGSRTDLLRHIIMAERDARDLVGPAPALARLRAADAYFLRLHLTANDRGNHERTTHTHTPDGGNWF